ncbi:Copper transport protein [Heracleum sosnowskyi]|uniref:Copper transport protein n=1 Tax=Heracleum sosnowskyi TaxID=360622 RepID=A0AAD8HSI8_9APIA|nr:Copper transport protein [Heracleum sosnowskyi]
MMHMTFYWGTNVTILFDSWKTNSITSYALSLFACFLISVFYQYMEDRRIKLKLIASSPPRSGLNVPLISEKIGGGGTAAKIAGAAMFGVNSAIGYMLMLAIMSFNGGVFVAVVLGLSVGYLVFRSGGDDDGVIVVDNPCACA